MLHPLMLAGLVGLSVPIVIHLIHRQRLKPQLLATGLSGMLEDRFGDAPDLRAIGGRALREMTRISASPYSMWRDIALTNKKNIKHALLKLEQRLAHVRENLDTRELAMEFERAHQLRKSPPVKNN